MERTIQLVQPMKLAERKLLRVAAYARVSCDKDAMKHSLAAQISYYNEYIQRHSDWAFAGVYADEAYSGTKDDRPHFVQMIKDCNDGKIDRIITKSISRFARNTVTLLTVVRDLRRMGIGIYFEEQSIDTLTEAGELMITLLASQAQEESRATSENCKWRIRKMFEDGYTTYFKIIGYQAVNGLVEMVPEETELVKRIFQLYLEGHGPQSIANILWEEKAPTCRGGEWVSATVRGMLHNEKYVGDLLLQKTFVEDHITKTLRKNKGEMAQYYIRDDHDAIIPREMFEAVREENTRRIAKYGHGTGTTTELTSLVQCGICGKNYRRKTAKARVFWRCTTYDIRGKKYCASNSIPETTLKEVCCQVLGLAEYDPNIIAERIERIVAMPDKMLAFHLSDGTVKEVKWALPSRSESWTTDMRQKAAEQMRRRHAETSHKAASTGH